MLPPSAKAAPMTSMSSAPLSGNSTSSQVQPGHPGSAAPGLQPAAFQQIPIRQVPSTEKEKKVKKPAPTRQELLKIMVSIDNLVKGNCYTEICPDRCVYRIVVNVFLINNAAFHITNHVR